MSSELDKCLGLKLWVYRSFGTKGFAFRIEASGSGIEGLGE